LGRVVPHFPAVAAAAATPGGKPLQGFTGTTIVPVFATTGMLGSGIDLQQKVKTNLRYLNLEVLFRLPSCQPQLATL
jgi:hypothetical protein